MEIIKNGEKFAAISLNGIRSSIIIDNEIKLEENIYVTRKIPFEVTDWWKEQLGEIESRKIISSKIFFIITEKNNNQKKQDDTDNNEIIEKCLNLFYAFFNFRYYKY